MGSIPTHFQQCQRIQVTKDAQGSSVSITLERFDAALGWYTAGAMSIPVCQMPLLEQALQDLSAQNCAECTGAVCGRKIIPFPLLAQNVVEVSASGA